MIRYVEDVLNFINIKENGDKIIENKCMMSYCSLHRAIKYDRKLMKSK